MYKYAASHSSAESVPDIEIYTRTTLLGFPLTRRGENGLSHDKESQNNIQ